MDETIFKLHIFSLCGGGAMPLRNFFSTHFSDVYNTKKIYIINSHSHCVHRYFTQFLFRDWSVSVAGTECLFSSVADLSHPMQAISDHISIRFRSSSYHPHTRTIIVQWSTGAWSYCLGQIIIKIYKYSDIVYYYLTQGI